MLHSALSSLVAKRTGNGIGGEEKDAWGKTCSTAKVHGRTSLNLDYQGVFFSEAT